MYADDFDLPDDRIWINCAHQGALPRVAAEAAREAVGWKERPWELTQKRFDGVPDRLRCTLGQLLDAPTEEIVLANSASYGLHLLANGFPWEEGDEALVVHGDFPSCVMPWMGLQDRDVSVRAIEPEQPLPSPEELAEAIGPRTRLFCSTWVHSFSGWTADLDGLGAVCRERGVTFVVNGSQALGARPFSAGDSSVDAFVSVGFKWLCGPYGTGLCWIRRELLESLRFNKSYWLSSMTAADLGDYDGEPQLPEGPATGRRYDVFGTANFFNTTAWTASLEYLMEQGLEAIRDHDERLVDRLVGGLDPDHYRLLSPSRGEHRSTLVFVSHRDPDRNRSIHEELGEAGIGVSFRGGRIRFAPHLYNTEADIDRALEVLAEAGQ